MTATACHLEGLCISTDQRRGKIIFPVKIFNTCENPCRTNHLNQQLQIAGLDIDKNAISRIESGERFVTDIGLKVIAEVLKTSVETLLVE